MGDYRLTRDADADLVQMFLYGFESFGVRKAEEYRDGMVRCLALLAENPRLGRPAEEVGPGTRRHEHAQHVIFYNELPDGLLITAIVHERSMRRVGGPEA